MPDVTALESIVSSFGYALTLASLVKSKFVTPVAARVIAVSSLLKVPSVLYLFVATVLPLLSTKVMVLLSAPSTIVTELLSSSLKMTLEPLKLTVVNLSRSS